MTSRERLQAVLAGRVPDRVPVAPDLSYMVPARLTGKPFWDLYLYKDPPIWQAYVDCAKHFDFDSLMDGYFPLRFPDDALGQPPWETFVVFRSNERIVTQDSYVEGRKRVCRPTVDVYYADNPPTRDLPPAKLSLPAAPKRYEPLEGVRPVDTGPEGLRRLKADMGPQGLVGVFLTSSAAFRKDQGVFEYYDNPDKHEQWAAERLAAVQRRFQQIMAMGVRPDFLCVGGSGTLVWQTVEMFRKVAFPAVKRGIELATAAGLPTHLHSCGPEAKLVKIMADETDLTVIDPLEPPPMGDCDLGELKRLYGNRIVLKGNLHTTDVMLRGTAAEVAAAARRAIDAAAAGGRFILSSGDQCGRDTPDENIRAMIETARTYGRY